MNPYEQLVAEAEHVGWRVAVFIESVERPRERCSKLTGIALLDRERHVVSQASLLHDDCLDRAAVQLLPVVANRRTGR